MLYLDASNLTDTTLTYNLHDITISAKFVNRFLLRLVNNFENQNKTTIHIL